MQPPLDNPPRPKNIPTAGVEELVVLLEVLSASLLEISTKDLGCTLAALKAKCLASVLGLDQVGYRGNPSLNCLFAEMAKAEHELGRMGISIPTVATHAR